MTLTELRAHRDYRHLFYRNQDWFLGEKFMNALPNERSWKTPSRFALRGKVPKKERGLWLAVDLAHAFVVDPESTFWEDRWIWCRDKDAGGRRVFCGVRNGRYQIHRHIAVDHSFGVAVWE